MNIRCIAVQLTAVLLLVTVAAASQQLQGTVYVVQSITDMGGGRIDVKLMNPRTHYVHSITVVAGVIVGILVGDLVEQIESKHGTQIRKVGQTNPNGTGERGPLQPGGTPASQEPNAGQNPARPSTPNDGGLPLPPDVRQQLLKGAAEMDRIMTKGQDYTLAGTNRFFDCMSKAIEGDLRFLAQPAYVPAAQMAQSLHDGVWKYITSGAYTNNREMFQAAMDSLKRLRDDPACWFGQAAPGAAAAAITHIGGAAVEAAEAQKAANAAIRTANAAAERRAAFGAGGGSSGGRPLNRFNPACAPNMCFPSAIAQDLTWETGEPFAAEAFSGNVEVQILKGVPTKVYNITHQKTVENLLSGLFGNKKLQGPPLTGQRLQDHMWGRPTVSSYQGIVDELKAAKPLSRGLVFIEQAPSAQNPLGTGHVINARNVGNKIIFTDASNSNMDGTSFFQGATGVKFYRTK